jgi:phage gp16-like protein
MLDIKNIPVQDINQNKKINATFVRMKNQMDVKMASYLRYLGTKNAVNRASDYHYLCLAVTDSTAPVNGIDYIHPSVKPVVDYATAVITKGLIPNGEINFDFVADGEEDEVAARQATQMVSKVVNQMNDPHFILERWVMDAAMHKNGMMMIKPVREQITRYVETSGTSDQLRAFEQQAAEAGLTALRQSKRRENVDMMKVMEEATQLLGEQKTEYAKGVAQKFMMDFVEGDEATQAFGEQGDAIVQGNLDEQESIIQDSIRRNTTYKAKYKLTGYNINVKFHPIAQHYWICDPTVPEMKDQPFCGYYDPMTIQEATELYPGIVGDLDNFRQFAEYNMNGAYQAGSVLNNLAIHARDSVPVMGIPVSSAASADPDSRQVSIVTVWNKYDIDGDGELELVELIYSGSYIISAREVEFIPVANMCPKPLPGNFYGMSIAESVIPMQEYNTSAARAEIQLGLLTATPRIGVKPDRVDFEMMQDGESAIFILDSKFDPAKDIYQMPPPSGNLQFLEVAMQRIQQDTMAMVGMTTPSDVFNPEVMAPGNSGVKLQMALSPNQIIQDNTVRNAAEGLREALWLVWRTLIQYGDDYGVKKLAQGSHPDKKAEFLDFLAWDDMNFCDRKQIHLELALGMKSEENALGRLQIIQKCQTELYAMVQNMATAGSLTPEIYKKVKKPFEDTLYVLGVKDCNTYLPTNDEVVAMIEAGKQAQANKQPSPSDQKDMSVAKLNEVKAQQIAAEVAGQDAESQLDFMSMAMGDPKVYS